MLGVSTHPMRRWAISLIFVLVAHVTASAAFAAGDIQVICNSRVPVNELSLSTLRATYSMRVRQWSDGTPIRVFVLPDRDDLHASFSKDVLHVYPYVLRDTWDRMVFTGTGHAPIEVANQQEMLQRVSTTPGAIGYVQNGKVPNEKIKVLQVQ